MKEIKVRAMEIGRGMTKICVSDTGKDVQEILLKAETIVNSEADLLEWRMDYYKDIVNLEALKAVGKQLRACLGEMPMIATFRTKEEGGERSISSEMYRDICLAVIEAGVADIIDVEIMQPDHITEKIIKAAHEAGVAVIASNHDFAKTPGNAVLMARFGRMQRAGADIFKLAMMPNSAKDVVRLMDVTEQASCFNKPIVTMSMSGRGLITRIAGEAYGNAITFGAVGDVSAPGQIQVAALKSYVQMIHEQLPEILEKEEIEDDEY